MADEMLADTSGRAAERQRAGDWDGAAEAYAEMFQRAVEAGDLARLLDALRGQSHVRRCQEQYDHATELAWLRCEIAGRTGFRGHSAWAVNNAAAILHYQGNLDEARLLYEQALERAREVRDDHLIRTICQNQGVIANVQGDLAGARAFYLESMASVVRSGDWAAAVQVYNNLGMVCADLQEWMEAEVYFSRGIEIAEQLGEVALLPLGDLALLAKLHMNRAEPLIHVGELLHAREALDRAEAIAARVKERKTLSDIARFRGIIARREGDLEAANQHLANSLLIAAKAGAVLERAETLEELARLRWEEGRAAEAYSALREARQGFLTLRAARDVARVEALLAHWETEDLLAEWQQPGGEVQAARAGCAPPA